MVNITDYSNKQIGSGITLERYKVNSDTTLSLFGNGVNNYSLPLFENFIYLLSNFASPFPPGTNFVDYYQTNNNWVPSTDSLYNTKTILNGQLWFQSSLLPVMSDEIYNIVYQLVNSPNLSNEQITSLENELLTIYNNSTNFQLSGCLWIMNGQNNTHISPLSYNLSGIGNIEVYDVSSLGWVKIYPTNIDSLNNINLKNTNSNLNFYTSSDLSTITSNISASGGTNNSEFSGNLSLNCGTFNLNTSTTNLNSSIINLTAPNINVTSSNFTLNSNIPTSDNSQKIATTAFVKSVLGTTITEDGGEITGTLLVPDPTNDNSRQVANAEYVNNQISKLPNSGKTKIVSVLDYSDSDDITSAIQTMITKGIGYIYIPSGIYLISSSISLSETNLELFGDGNSSIIIQDFDDDLFTISANNISISNLQFQCSVTNRTKGSVILSNQYNNIDLKNILITSAQNSFFNGVTLSSCSHVYLNNVIIQENIGYGINLTSSKNIVINGNTFEDCGKNNQNEINALTCDANCSNIQIVNNFIGNSSSDNEYQNYGVNILTNNNVICSNNIFYNNKGGINLTSGSNVVNVGNIVN